MISLLHEAGYLADIDYYFARTLGRIGRESEPLVLLAAAAVSRFTREGHVCLDLARLAGKPLATPEGDRIAGLSWPDKEAWLTRLTASRLTSDGSRPTPLVLDGAGRLYLMRYWRYQETLAGLLLARAAGEPPPLDEPLLAEGLDRLFPPPDENGAPDWQRLAADKAVRHRLALISGGPGTGKTTTVAKILVLLLEQTLAEGEPPPRILLTAPTGKAATRLKESMRSFRDRHGDRLSRLPDTHRHLPREGMTLHRALGMGRDAAGRFAHGPDNPLPVDILVLDEASMVSLALMTRILEALPESARLILLGDKDQLASVEAGAILGDICASARPPIREVDGDRGIAGCISFLKRNFRSQPGIDELAGLIREGAADQVLHHLVQGRWEAVEFIPCREDALYRMDLAIDELAAAGFAPYLEKGLNPAERIRRFNAFRVLCAHHQGGAGVERLNRLIEAGLTQRGLLMPDPEGYPGRPVMVTRNDYQRELFNGDTGLILRDGPGRLQAFFAADGQAVRRFSPGRLPSHVTVFAMTIHKSQGSEFDHVLLVLPPRGSPILTRELIYTAVTRARSRVTILAPPQGLRAAIETPVFRASGLADRLGATSANRLN